MGRTLETSKEMQPSAYSKEEAATLVLLDEYEKHPQGFWALQILFPALSIWMQQRFAGRIIAGEEPDMATVPAHTFPIVRPHNDAQTADAQEAFRAWMEGTGSWRDDFA